MLTPHPAQAQGYPGSGGGNWNVTDAYGDTLTAATNGYPLTGTCNTGLWHRDKQTTTDYSYYQPYPSTSAAPFTPAPGWNPPGYH